MKKILMVLTSVDEIPGSGEPTGFHVGEAAHPWKVLTDAGHVVDYASPAGGTPIADTLDEDDEVQVAFAEDELVNAALANTPKLEDVAAEQYDGIFLVGGHGTMWDFPESKALANMVKEIYEAGGVVAAVCHGPAGLVDVELNNGLHLVEARQVAAFTNEEEREADMAEVVPFLLEDRLTELGATVKTAENWAENVVVDERLVTGQNPASAAGVASEMAKLLEEVVREEKAEDEAAAEALRAEKDAEKDEDAE